MRLICNLSITKNITIAYNFRQFILFLIKEAILNSEGGKLFYQSWYTGNKPKPFTFSFYIPMKNDNGKVISNADFLNIIFSTNNIEFFTRVYNGLNNISKNKSIKIFDMPFEIKYCRVLPEQKFSNQIVTFKTLSPVLLRKMTDNKYYLYPNDIKTDKNIPFGNFKRWVGVSLSEFKKALETNISLNTGNNIEICDINSVRIIPIKCSSTKSNFSVTYPAIKAVLSVKSNPETLKLIYDIGIGARKSEGFGMLEVINE